MKSFSRGLTSLCTLLLCVLSCVLAIFDDHQCAPGQFKVISKNAESFLRCQTCYMCPPGYGVHKECSETADTVCRRCPEGWYSDSSTRRGGCKQCTPCMDEHDTLQECTANSDRVCRNPCDTGKFLNVEHRRCDSCSFCHEKVNVNVSRNAQCENQGLPPMWTCWPNITVTTDTDENKIVVNTGETYSYITATNTSRGGYRGALGPPLKDFLSDYMNTAATTIVPKKKTTPQFDDDGLHSSVIAPVEVSSRSGQMSASTPTTAFVSSQNVANSSISRGSSVEHVAMHGIVKHGVGNIILQIIAYSLVLVLTLTVIIQRYKIKSLSGKNLKKPTGIGRQISYEQGVQRNQAWELKEINREDENVSEELLQGPRIQNTGA